MTRLLVAASVSLLLQASPVLRAPTSDLRINAAPAVTVRQLTYAQLDGSRNSRDAGRQPGTPRLREERPAILFLHWYGPPHPTSNRTQFLPEAVELAAATASMSLLVDTPWTRERWFGQRDSAKDYEFTVQMAKDVRRALDVLLAQPGIDRTRVAVVGHDFGAMWGALAVAADPRVTHFVYAAGTRHSPTGTSTRRSAKVPERDAFVAKLAPLDPINFLPKIAPRPVLLQFGTKDPHVKNEAAKAQADATKDPKTVRDLRQRRARTDVPGEARSACVAARTVQAAEVSSGRSARDRGGDVRLPKRFRDVAVHPGIEETLLVPLHGVRGDRHDRKVRPGAARAGGSPPSPRARP